MARPEVTGRKIGRAIEGTGKVPPDKPAHNSKPARRGRFSDVRPAAYTIQTFCVAHDLSESFYHKLKKDGRAPREMHVGARVLISFEAAADWRRENEQSPFPPEAA